MCISNDIELIQGQRNKTEKSIDGSIHEQRCSKTLEAEWHFCWFSLVWCVIWCVILLTSLCAGACGVGKQSTVLSRFLTEILSFVLEMKLFSLFSVILLLALHASTICSINIDDKLLHQILNDPQLSDLLNDPEKLMDMLKEKLRSSSKSGNKCSVAINKRHEIIRTRESEAAGAVFLTALTVDSSEACINACCANSSCNTAVMRHKVR